MVSRNLKPDPTACLNHRNPNLHSTLKPLRQPRQHNVIRPPRRQEGLATSINIDYHRRNRFVDRSTQPRIARKVGRASLATPSSAATRDALHPSVPILVRPTTTDTHPTTYATIPESRIPRYLNPQYHFHDGAHRSSRSLILQQPLPRSGC